MSGHRRVSVHEAVQAIDQILRALLDMRSQARAEWMAIDPVAITPPALGMLRGRMDAADRAYALALERRKAILGDNVDAME